MLNEAQKRSLSAALRIVEEYLREIEGMLASGDYTGILSERINDVSDGERAGILEKAALIREGIKIVAEKFNLDRRRTSISGEALARLASCWEILSDSTAGRLKRYGAVDKRVEKILDPQVDALIALLGEIERKLRK